MALVGPPDEEYQYQLTGAFGNEWVFIDDRTVDRFGREGHTLHPGPGTRWHLYRGAPMTSRVRSPVQQWSDIEELPWQVVAILDQESLDGLRNQQAERK